MKAKLASYYRSSKTGQPVFVYHVTGTPEELAAYEAAKGAFFRKDDKGNILHFATRALSNNRNEAVTLSITTNGNIVVDDLNKVLDQNAKLEDYIMREQAKIMAAQALARSGVRGLALMQAQPQPAAEEIVGAQNLQEVEVPEEIPA